MKYLLLALLLSCTTSPRTRQQELDSIKLRNLIRDVQEASFATGCFQSFVSVNDLGWYVRPDGYTGREVYLELKQVCLIEANRYKLEQIQLDR